MCPIVLQSYPHHLFRQVLYRPIVLPCYRYRSFYHSLQPPSWHNVGDCPTPEYSDRPTPEHNVGDRPTPIVLPRSAYRPITMWAIVLSSYPIVLSQCGLSSYLHNPFPKTRSSYRPIRFSESESPIVLSSYCILTNRPISENRSSYRPIS